jgi:multiple sugar transport system substrate-binding protein
MKRRTKILAVIATAVSLTLAACSSRTTPIDSSSSVTSASGSSPATAEAPTIEYGLLADKPYDGEAITFVICCQAAAQFAAWRASVPKFTELTGIQVNFTDDPLDGLREKIVTQSIADPGSWDVGLYFDTWQPELTDFLEPLDNVMTVDLSDYPAATADLGQWDGTTYGIPARSHVMMLHYRTDVFDELGLKVPETYDEILDAAKAISDSDLGIAGFTTNWAKQPSISPIPWMSLIESGGASAFDADGNPQFDSPAVVKATEVYRDLSKFAPNGAVAYNEGDSRTAFAQGKAAMTLAWSWAHEVFTGKDALPEVAANAGSSAVIPADGKAGNPIAMAWPIGISSSSEHKGAAAEWVKWVTNPDLDREIISNKSDPALATVVANRISSMVSESANAKDANDGFSASMADAYKNATHQPIYLGFASVTEIIEAALSDIMGGADIEETLKSANEQARAALDRVN